MHGEEWIDHSALEKTDVHRIMDRNFALQLEPGVVNKFWFYLIWIFFFCDE